MPFSASFPNEFLCCLACGSCVSFARRFPRLRLTQGVNAWVIWVEPFWCTKCTKVRHL